MMPQQESAYPCPKCGQHFPLSQMNAHYATCQGRPVQQNTMPFPNLGQPYPQHQAPPQMYIPPPTPVHTHQWFENDTYKVCVSKLYDPTSTCTEIKLRKKGVWFIFVRYGFKLFWIELIFAFAVAFAVSSALGIRR